jgi:hypothetical protein
VQNREKSRHAHASRAAGVAGGKEESVERREGVEAFNPKTMQDRPSGKEVIYGNRRALQRRNAW